MPLYRALRTLSGSARRGELTRLAHLDAAQIAKLEQVGAVSRVAAPPLSELPGWQSRAGKLAKVGIGNAEEYLEADPIEVSKTLRVKPDTEARYRDELYTCLLVPPMSLEE